MTLESKNITLMYFVDLLSPVQVYMWGYSY